MLANVIQKAFDAQPCLPAQGELLEGFQVWSCRHVMACAEAGR